MKASLKKIAVLALGGLLALTCFACGPGVDGPTSSETPSETGGTGGNDKKMADTISLYVAAVDDQRAGIARVCRAYEEANPGVTIKDAYEGSAASYGNNLNAAISDTDNKYDIVQISAVSAYYGTDKVVNLTSYLNEKNPYSDNRVWRTNLDPEAYKVDPQSGTIPALAFESNYMAVFYNKNMVRQTYGDNWTPPATWAELLSQLEAAKTDGYSSPLALNYDEAKAGGISDAFFGWLMRMYTDQYFKDAVDAAHVKEGDYNYEEGLDPDYAYDPNDMLMDSYDGYTYNLSRLIDTCFSNDFNFKSDRYADIMANMKDLIAYSSPNFTIGSAMTAFNESVLHYLTPSSYSKRALFVLNRLEFYNGYQTNEAFYKTDSSGKKVQLNPNEMMDEIGWFAMPPMSDYGNDGVGAPASNKLRSIGGANNACGILNTKDSARTNRAIDFMKFWYSQKGQNAYYSQWYSKDLVCAMPNLVKDFTIKARNDKTQDIAETFIGDCDLNPYNQFGYGYQDEYKDGNGYANKQVLVAQISDYLRNGTAWQICADNIQTTMNQAFVHYAEALNLRFTDPTQAKNYFTTTPYL